MAKRSFEEWMAAVDALISYALAGLNSSDLPDCCYLDWYDDGVTPKGAAKRALRQFNSDE